MKKRTTITTETREVWIIREYILEVPVPDHEPQTSAARPIAVSTAFESQEHEEPPINEK